MAGEESSLPQTEEIEPFSDDPIYGLIEIESQLGSSLEKVPNPLFQALGNFIGVSAAQQEALHLTITNLLRFRNFVDAGGIEATTKEAEKLSQDPSRVLDLPVSELNTFIEETIEELRVMNDQWE